MSEKKKIIFKSILPDITDGDDDDESRPHIATQSALDDVPSRTPSVLNEIDTLLYFI